MLVHAVDYAPDGAVDYGPFGPVDYDASHLWITHLSALWITMLRICGLRTCGAVDFPALRARAHIATPVVLWA